MISCRECPHRIDCQMDGRCKMNDITPNNPRQTGTISNIEEPNWNKEKPRIPEFIDLLEQSKAIHLKKNADYASAANPFSNFERSALLMQWFKDPIDKSFVNLIGTKLARIAELSDGRSPNNESLDDSFLDLLTYVGLWGAYVKKQRNQIKNE